MSKDWRIAPLWPRREGASSEWNVSPLVAQILYNRNIETLQAARSFLAPQLAGLHEPGELPGTGEAAELVAQAVRRGQRIVIYGDYDVDGMTGSAILWHLLRLADAQVEVYVPHRIEEGYGINVASLDRLPAGRASWA
jgi:single-stranded-DNA-specific exonuclease